MTMITFDHDADRFTLRTVGVALDNGRVLLHRSEADDFWALPGGRCELGETAAESLRREMVEELEAVVEVERLLWVAENFFYHGGCVHHELGLYWLMRMPEEWLAAHRAGPFLGYEGDSPMIFQWFDLSTLESVVLHPAFLRRALSDLPATPEYVIQRS